MALIAKRARNRGERVIQRDNWTKVERADNVNKGTLQAYGERNNSKWPYWKKVFSFNDFAVVLGLRSTHNGNKYKRGKYIQNKSRRSSYSFVRNLHILKEYYAQFISDDIW